MPDFDDSMCASWQSTSEIGPFGIDYEHFYYCEMAGVQFLATVIMVSWVIYLIRILGGTASSYLSPTLANVCERFKVPYDLAGVTLLAFGNGAPDVFASIASFSGPAKGSGAAGSDASSNSVLVGLGSLLGGGVFVTTVVVGAIAYFCPCEVSRHIFTRDIGFHLLAVTSLAIVGAFGRINIWTSVGLFLLYLLYVGVVFSLMWMSKPEKDVTDIQMDDLSLKISSSSPLQTAFWHKQASSNSSNNNKNNNYNNINNSISKTNTKSNSKVSQPRPTKSYSSASSLGMEGGLFGSSLLLGSSALGGLNSSTASSGYTFLILDNDINSPTSATATATASGGGGGGGGGLSSSDGRRIVRAPDSDSENDYNNDNNNNYDDDDDDDDDVSISFAGGGMSGGNMFDGVIIEDYVSGMGGSNNSNSSSSSNSNSYQSEIGEGNLTESLLSHDESEYSNRSSSSNNNSNRSSNNNSSDNGGNNSSSSSSRSGSKQIPVVQGSDLHSRVLTALYWRQKAIANKFRKGLLSNEFWDLNPLDKAVWIVDFPSNFLRAMTIPSLEPELWNKYISILQPIVGALFVGFCLGDLSAYVLGMPYFLLAILVASPASALIYFFTHFNYPPSGKVAELLWIAWSFFMCIMWIFVIAKELVSCLSSLGVVLDISPSFLGLTVLAWGNSVGDFFANTAVAKRGLGQMALAGCYGGPVFNILIGLGTAFAFASSQSYPDSYPIHLDGSSLISIITLYIALISTLVLVTYNNNRLDKNIGMYLVCVYITYTIAQVILVNTSH